MNTIGKHQFDLEERTLQFAKNIIDLCRKTPKNIITIPIIEQLLRAGTSPGANYREANSSFSKKDFRNKICICRKESKETIYWLQLLEYADNTLKNDCDQLCLEAKELLLIFSKIVQNTK